MLAHYFAARYAGLIAVDRFYPGAAPPAPRAAGADREPTPLSLESNINGLCCNAASPCKS
jgi:hypothetical protein